MPANAGDLDWIPGSGRSPGEGNGNPLQYSCLGNHKDRGAWRATAHGLAKESVRTYQLNSKSGGRLRGLCRLPGGKGACRPLVGGAGSWPSGRLAVSRGVSRRVCPERALGSLVCLLMGGAVSKPSWLFGFRHPVSSPLPGASFVWGRFLALTGQDISWQPCWFCWMSPSMTAAHVRVPRLSPASEAKLQPLPPPRPSKTSRSVWLRFPSNNYCCPCSSVHAVLCAPLREKPLFPPVL